MDPELAKELLAVIDERISHLEKSREELLKWLSGEKVQSSVSPRLAGKELSENTGKVYETLLSMNRSVSPKELFAELKHTGVDLADQRVRQILMRWKGRLFKSPKRGTWRAILLS